MMLAATLVRSGDLVHEHDSYVKVYLSEHPLAGRKGAVWAHRVALFDVIGSGSHPCHHCGILVDWAQPFPHGLVVDHLDKIKRNNDLDNLVPSCHPCNAGRGANRAKTHCPSGHEYTPENTYLNRRGHRFCRACNNNRSRRGYAARKAATGALA